MDRSTLRSALGFLLIMVAGGGVGALASRLLGDHPGWGLTPAGRALLVAALLLMLPFVLLVHELGHILGGRLVGFRFRTLIVGPVRVDAGRAGLAWSVNRSVALAGGIAIVVPETTDGLRQRMAVVTAGGPAVSLAAGLLLLGAYFGLGLGQVRPETHGASAFLVAALTLGFGAASAAIGLVTLTPGVTSGFATDGGRLLGLLRGGPEAEREAAILTTTALSAAGRRPAIWPRELVAAMAAPGAGTLFEGVGRIMAYTHAVDAGDVAAAGSHLDRALALRDRLPGAVRPAAALEAAYFEAFHRGDAAAGRRWLALGAGGELVEEALRCRAEAAVLLAEGDVAGAAHAIARGRAAVREDPDAGSAAMESTALAALDARLERLEPARPNH